MDPKRPTFLGLRIRIVFYEALKRYRFFGVQVGSWGIPELSNTITIGLFNVAWSCLPGSALGGSGLGFPAFAFRVNGLKALGCFGFRV